MIDLFRAADGRLEGVVHTPDVGHTEFAGVLDLLRVLEGIDLRAPAMTTWAGSPPRVCATTLRKPLPLWPWAW
jgi:hypothetical protein